MPPGARVPFIAVWIALAAVLAGVGAMAHAANRRGLLLGVAASALLTLAGPAVFSIGVPLFICAMAVGLGAAKAGDELHLAWWKALAILLVLIVLAAALLAVGFAGTNA
ncbi:MAG: hypothetical protein ABI978_02545 [Chloroflexota bacterium]